VARSLADKDSDITSVKDFGAKGDGATDDTSAFLAASAAKSVFVPRGTYKLSSDVQGDFWSVGGVYFSSTGVAPVADARGPNTTGDPLAPELIAHRGFKGIAPENTIPSLTMAASLGATAVEADLQVSSDGVLYMMHDFTVDRTTNGTGTLTALTSAYIDSLVVDLGVGTLLANTRVPRFTDYMAAAAALGMKLYIEIKAVRTFADYFLVVDAVAAAGMAERVVLNSFTEGAITSIRGTYNQSLPISFGGDFYISNPEFQIDRMADYRGGLLWNKADLLARPQIAKRARARGVPLVVFTITDQAEIAPLRQMGVNKFICDFPMDVKGIAR
jgi:glycerophosphoryl diester phosphodiesterase